MDKMNGYFGYKVVEKIKLISFESNLKSFTANKDSELDLSVDINTKFINKIVDIKNDKIKNSLIKLNKIFKGK